MAIIRLLMVTWSISFLVRCSSRTVNDKNNNLKDNKKESIDSISKKNDSNDPIEKNNDSGKKTKMHFNTNNNVSQDLAILKKKKTNAIKIHKEKDSLKKITLKEKKFLRVHEAFFKKKLLIQHAIWISKLPYNMKIKLKNYIFENKLSIKKLYKDLCEAKKDKTSSTVYNDLKMDLKTEKEEKHLLVCLLHTKEIYENLRKLKKEKNYTTNKAIKAYNNIDFNTRNDFVPPQKRFSIKFPQISDIEYEITENHLEKEIENIIPFFKKVILNLCEGNKIDHGFSGVEKHGLENGIKYLQNFEIDFLDGQKEKSLFLYVLNKFCGFSIQDKILEEFDRYRYYNNLFNLESTNKLKSEFIKFFNVYIIPYLENTKVKIYDKNLSSFLDPKFFFNKQNEKAFFNNIENTIKHSKEKKFLKNLNTWISSENDEINKRINENLPLNLNLILFFDNRKKTSRFDLKTFKYFLELNKSLINYCVLEYKKEYIIKNLTLNKLIKEAKKKKLFITDKERDRFVILIDFKNVDKKDKVKIYVYQPPIKLLNKISINNYEEIGTNYEEYAKYNSSYELYLKNPEKYKALKEDYLKYSVYLNKKNELVKSQMSKYKLDINKINYKYILNDFIKLNMYKSAYRDLFILFNKENNILKPRGGDINSDEILILSKSIYKKDYRDIRLFYRGQNIKISDKNMLNNLMIKMFKI